MLLRTALVVVSLFGLPLLALASSWRREGAPPVGESSAPRRGRGGATLGYRTWNL
jgi:hypothetical protein